MTLGIILFLVDGTVLLGLSIVAFRAVRSHPLPKQDIAREVYERD